jgi:hypothetical protein
MRGLQSGRLDDCPDFIRPRFYVSGLIVDRLIDQVAEIDLDLGA